MAYIKNEIPLRTKTPAGVLNYGRDYTKWLKGDTIQSSTWAAPVGLTQVSMTNDTTSTAIVVSGGALHNSYRMVNTITMASGNIEAFSYDLKIVPHKG